MNGPIWIGFGRNVNEKANNIVYFFVYNFVYLPHWTTVYSAAGKTFHFFTHMLYYCFARLGQSLHIHTD